MKGSLAEFLLARLAEDVSVAETADEDSGSAWTSLDGRYVYAHAVVADVQRLGQLAHIVRFDPARVLAECDVRREVIGLHEHVLMEDGEWACLRCESTWWCGTLRALAQPFANHPDFDTEWAA